MMIDVEDDVLNDRAFMMIDVEDDVLNDRA